MPEYYVTITLTESNPQLAIPIGPYSRESALAVAAHYANVARNQGCNVAETSVNDGEEACYLVRDRDEYQVMELAVIRKD